MNSRIIILTLVICHVGLTLSFAQDPNMGTWKLNEAKSKLTRGAPKNTTVVYEPVGDNVKVTVDGVDASGKPTHNEWIGKFDGKDYPVTGDPNEDARSYTKIDDHTLGLNIRRSGKLAASGRIVISPNGKSRTVTMRGSDVRAKSSRALWCMTNSELSHPRCLFA
jgi:hypothetical protein